MALELRFDNRHADRLRPDIPDEQHPQLRPYQGIRFLLGLIAASLPLPHYFHQPGDYAVGTTFRLAKGRTERAIDHLRVG